MIDPADRAGGRAFPALFCTVLDVEAGLVTSPSGEAIPAVCVGIADPDGGTYSLAIPWHHAVELARDIRLCLGRLADGGIVPFAE